MEALGTWDMVLKIDSWPVGCITAAHKNSILVETARSYHSPGKELCKWMTPKTFEEEL